LVLWPLTVVVLAGLVILLAGLVILLAVGLRVRRYSPTHIVAQLTVRGRGLYFSRTPDGTWWRLRLRARCAPTCSGSGFDDPPAAGTPEPRRPPGPRPLTPAARP
jgi:hypothetical protein